MNSHFTLRLLGVVLFGAFFYHTVGMPWFFIGTAAVALCVIP